MNSFYFSHIQVSSWYQSWFSGHHRRRRCPPSAAAAVRRRRRQIRQRVQGFVRLEERDTTPQTAWPDSPPRAALQQRLFPAREAHAPTSGHRNRAGLVSNGAPSSPVFVPASSAVFTCHFVLPPLYSVRFFVFP